MTRRIEYAFLVGVLVLALAALSVFSGVTLAAGSGNQDSANESSNHKASGDQSSEGAGNEGSGEEEADNEAQAFGILQGQESEIQVGSVLGSATLRDSKCVIDTPISIGARVQNGSTPLAIVWRFDEQCRAVVHDIQPVPEIANTLAHATPAEGGQANSPVPDLVPSGSDPASTAGSASDSNSAEERAGWVSYTILEQFDVPATYVYAHLYYWEEDDSVSGGHSPYAYCWNSWFPGWTIEDCSSAYYPHGPDYVWIEVEGEFQNDLNIEYTQYAQWYGTAYGYSYRCDLTEGALPIFWEEVCRGGKVQQP